MAADMISQAEHDPHAASVLVTDSPELAQAVREELETQAATTKHSERVREALAGTQSGSDPGGRPGTGHRRRATSTPPNTWKSTTMDAAGLPSGSATPVPIFVGHYSR